MAITHKQLRVDEHSAGRADRAVQQLVQLPRSQVTGLFDHGCVRINSAPCSDTFTRVAPGDLIEVSYDPHRRYHPKPAPYRDPAFRIVFEDQHLIVVDKAPLALTVPTGEDDPRSLQERIDQYLSRSRSVRHAPHAHVVHRLDRGTSGLLVFAKSAQAAHLLKDQFAAHKPERVYFVIVKGELDKRRGTFRSYLATAANLDRYSTPNKSKGDLAVTHYQTLQRLDDATLVRVTLETGRRNQIRVHFAEANHPVLGDTRYESALAKHPRWHYRRLALHAAVLGFKHPITGEPLRFELPLPTPFEQFLARKQGRSKTKPHQESRKRGRREA